jgi:GNAT superfamily N-acetyltransferase
LVQAGPVWLANIIAYENEKKLLAKEDIHTVLDVALAYFAAERDSRGYIYRGGKQPAIPYITLPKDSKQEQTMTKELQILAVDNPEWAIIGGGIHAFNIEQAGEDHGQMICFVLQRAEQEIFGGIIAATHWNWLYIDLMWIKEEFRGQGYGSRLLAIAEEKGRQLGAKNAYLDTFSFQAPEFYKKHGYQIFGKLEDFPVRHQRLYLTKKL